MMKAINMTCLFLLMAVVGMTQTPYESLNYLYSIQGNNTIGGIHNRQPISNPNQYSQQLHSITGDWPGLYSSDFMFESWEIDDRQTMINQVILEWNNGAMINLMWHACNPAGGEPCNWDSGSGADVKSSLTNGQWNALLTNGTALNNNWKAMMDEIATFLQQLEDAGVEVFFRPLHEMNQGMFWWGGRPGPNGTAALYRLTHDYLTYDKGLSNLIWVWNLQDFGSLASDLNSYDPGGSYWDVLTLDMYWTDGYGYTTAKYNAMVNKANGKPIGIGECEDLPAVNLLDQQPLWTFFMGWSELTFNNSNQKIQDIFWSGRVIVLDEMPGWQGTGTWQNSTVQYLQAEDYSNTSGVTVQATTDPEGGNQKLTNIQTNDWMSYHRVNVPASGDYTIAYRVKGNGGGTVQFEQAGGAAYGSISVPANSNWATIYQTVTLSAGVQDFGIKALSGGWDFNWWSLTPVSSARSVGELRLPQLEAKAYPNPFSETVKIQLSGWDGQSAVDLQIFDVSGKLVRTLDATQLTDDRYVQWDGLLATGEQAPRGIYYFQFYTGRDYISGKLIKE
ncbi:glycosyl hydrolase [Marinoscillum furvescens]|uniref:Putative secreted protein (Por secretion system target) n=1 Tax=Marinoscillum furvescens DSM 4134 TaxID=1122208 RepID=A0A3D9L074_MARFU|nr:glycosyl hydrolase [Marinoscillum furvescens]RED95303.1 putative secreted protein (Por secretion system target) [Marinoscillum furvescens DSM 4134]